MESTFLIIVVVLFFLAVTDLIVGVSNDAVNFLNSAIGSRAGSFKHIMIIASIGILFGSVCSSGMMEVARKGVFNPQYFTVDEIMFLFAAVMLTDIILLDLFNTFALPTSTTVSIVFELLGAALAIGFFSTLKSDESIKVWGEHINGSSAVIIIVGIFLSVVIAFFSGWFIQHITRLIIGYDYEKTMRSFGAVFGAASVALIMVFIVQKGLKGVPFVSKEVLEAIKEKTGLISLISAGVSFVIFQILIGKKGFSIYRVVTFLGTFALAMAFASNDLVNFIGVPIASFDSFSIWKQSGAEPTSFTMDALSEPVKTNQIFLWIAGVIMTCTLWFSKKAKSVVQTSVNLSRQEEGKERFEPNEVSRGLVRAVQAISNGVNRFVPESLKQRMNDRFKDPQAFVKDRPAFDLVRASVNLVVSAALILGATSLKLPLSTTFVTFMVLMGSSLADKAWSKGSAVYRVSGVLTVIGGWLLTAIIAVTTSIVFASLLYFFQIYALIGLVIVAILVIFKNTIFYNKNRYKAEVDLAIPEAWFNTDFYEIESKLREELAYVLQRAELAYTNSISALQKQDLKDLDSMVYRLEEVEMKNDLFKYRINEIIKNVENNNYDSSKALIFIHDMETDLLEAIAKIIRITDKYIKNIHPRIIQEQMALLTDGIENRTKFMEEVIQCLKVNKITLEDYNRFKTTKKELLVEINNNISNQINWASSNQLSSKNNELILTIQFAAQDLVITVSTLIKLFYKIHTDKTLKEILVKMVDE